MCTKISVDNNARTSYVLHEKEEQRNLLLLMVSIRPPIYLVIPPQNQLLAHKL